MKNDDESEKYFMDLATRLLLPEGGLDGLDSNVYNIIKKRVGYVALALKEMKEEWLSDATENALSAMSKYRESVGWSCKLREAIMNSKCEEQE